MDRELRERIRAGDPAAFGRLFDACARAVYNHAYRMTGDWSTAEEVMAVTFLEAWRCRARVEPDGGPLRPWLLGIATNTCRSLRRAARRHREVLAHMPPPVDVQPDFADEAAGRLDDAERLAVLRPALDGLRRSEREVLVLCVWSGLGYAEAAEALGVPVGTVRSRLSRARAKLQRLTERELTRSQRGRVPARNRREPDPVPRQEEGGRATAAPSTQEAHR
ncbi:RNA polymerase sigma factor [Streptacidiphilus rugosus]|uniref:RNA polymerase sigma factor n=1 Tax=Streptacidiphilus rugosus TaxID=405783 RepID=UPI00068B4292